MKKIYTILSVLMLLTVFRVYGQCDTITSFPFTETFEDDSPSRVCWTQQTLVGNEQWIFGNGTANGGPGTAFEGSLNARFTDEGDGAKTKLISPVFDLSAYTTPCILSFYYAQGMWSGDQNILRVYYRTSSAEAWVLIFTDNANRPNWTYQSLVLPFPSATYQLAFEATDNYGYANVLDLVRVNPPCAQISDFPFTETFEHSSPSRYCWTTEAISGNKSWSFQAGALSGSVETAHSGELNAWFTNSWGSNYVSRLISPVFDMSGSATPLTLSFYYAQEAYDTYQNYLNVYYRTGPQASWELLFSDSTNRPSWTLASMSLPAASATYQLAFEGSTNNGYANVIDKVMISACSIPQMVQFQDIKTDSATISWMSGGLEYSWDLKSGIKGFDPEVTGTLQPGLNIPSFTLTNLDEGTIYDVYLRPVCYAGEINPWIGPYRFYTRYAIPYFEGFDDVGSEPMANGWQTMAYTQISYGNPRVVLSSPGYSEPNCAMLDHCTDYKKVSLVSTDPTKKKLPQQNLAELYQGEALILVSPEMLVPINQLRVTFYASFASEGSCGISGLSVGSLSDPADISTFNEIQVEVLTDSWQKYTVYLNNYQGNDRYIGFKLILSDLGSGRAVIDDILFSFIPSCIEPNGLQVYVEPQDPPQEFLSNVLLQHEISISWNPGQNESLWDVIYDPAGFDPLLNGTLAAGLTLPSFTATNLASGTIYDFYVRANCGDNDLSEWSGPLVTSTPCGEVSAPVLQDFDLTAVGSLPLCWTALSMVSAQVAVVEDVNTSAPKSLMMLNEFGVTDTVFFISPAISNPMNTLMISFNAYSYDYGNMLTMGTMSDPADPATFTPVYDFNLVPVYSDWVWDFYDYTGTDQYIAFRLTEDAVVLLDDIRIEVPFYCDMPDSLVIDSISPNSVTISWVGISQEDNWDIIFGSPGFDPYLEGTEISGITQNPYTIGNLSPGNAYEFYVSANCSNGDWSDWSGPLVATTWCEPQPLPWFEDFESTATGETPDCMTVTDGNGDGQGWTTGTGGITGQAIVLIPPVGQQSQDDWFFSPPFELLEGHTYTVSFEYMADPSNPNNQVDVFNGTAPDPQSMDTGILINVTVINTIYETASFVFVPDTNGINVFGWQCISGSPQSTIFIDNISISETVLVTCPPDFSVCSGGFPVVLSGASPAGGVYSGVGVYMNQSQQPVFDPTLVTSGPHTITYTYTTTYGVYPCTFTVMVNELPLVSCPADMNIASTAAPLLLSGGMPAGGTYYGQAVVNNTFNPGMAVMGANSVLYMYTDPVSLCQGSCSFAVIKFEDIPVTCPPDFSVCSGGFPVVLSGASPAGGVYSGVGVYMNQSQQPVFDPTLVTSGPHTITYTYTTTYGVYPCTFTAMVNELPLVSCPPDMNIASTAAPLLLSGGMPAGGTYYGQAVVNNTFNPGMAVMGANSVLYMYTDPISLCQGSCSFAVIKVEDIPVTCPPDFSICSGGSPVVLSGASPAGGVYSGVGVYMNQSQQPVFDPTLVSSGPHTITYTYTTTYGVYPCTFTAMVNELPIVSCPADMNIASTAAPLLLSGGMPAGGTYYGQAVVNNTFDPGMAVMGANSVLYMYTDPVSLCQGSCSFAVNMVEDIPVTCPSDFSVCSGGFPVVLSGASPAGGVYSGVGVYMNQSQQPVFDPTLVTSGPHTITYTYTTAYGVYPCTFTAMVNELPLVSCPTDMNIASTAAPLLLSGGMPAGGTYYGQAVVNNTFNPGMAVMGANSVMYMYTDPISLCQGSCSFAVIKVEDIPVTCPPDFSICSGGFPVVLSGASPAGGVYSGVGVYMNQSQQPVFDPTLVTSGPHTITYTYTTTYGVYPCTFTAMVNELPLVSCPADMNIASTAAPLLLSGGMPAGGTYYGQAVLNNTFDPGMAVMGANSVLYMYTDPVSLCQGSCSFAVIKVEDIPVTCPPDFSVCSGGFPVVLSGASPAGGVYSGVGVYMNQSQQPVFDPTLVTSGPHTITYTYTTTYGVYPCTFTAMVNELPLVSCPADMNIASTAAPLLLSGGMPAGGTYYGQAVVNNTFNPGMAVMGANSVMYMYTDPVSLCQGSCSFAVNMVEDIPVTCPPDFSVCSGGFPVVLSGASPAGGVYSGVGVYMNQSQQPVFDPLLVTSGPHTITYTYTTAYGVYPCTFTAMVNELPLVSCPADMNIASTAAPFLLSGGMPAGGTYYGQAVVNNTFNPGMAVMGANSVMYMYTDPISLCQGSCSFAVTMTEVINLSCPDDTVVCQNSGPFILTGGLPAGGVYSGIGVYGGQNQEYIFDPVMAGAGSYPILYTYTTPYGQYQCSFQVTINMMPFIGCPADIIFCYGNPPLTLTGGTPAGGTYSGPGVSGSVFDANVAGIGSHVIQYSYTDANQCTFICEFSIDVYAGQVLEVQVVADTLNVCMGLPVTFTAITQNAGPDPLIQWYVNNLLQAATGPTFQITPASATSVYCIVTSFVPCIMGNYLSSNILTVNVFALLSPGLTIAVDEDTICDGNLVTFTVSSVADTGNFPVFQWQVNGINAGTNSMSYTYSPGNADLVKCLLSVAEPCATPAVATSNIVSVIIIPLPLVSINLPEDTVCIDWSPITLSGAIPSGGTYSGSGVTGLQFSPVIAGQGNHVIHYSYVDFYGCPGSDSASIYVDYCTGIPVNSVSETITLYPNPAKEKLIVSRNNGICESADLHVYDMMGKIIQLRRQTLDEHSILLDTSTLEPGVYSLCLDKAHRKFVVVR